MEPKIYIIGKESDVEFISPTSVNDPDFDVPTDLQVEFTKLIEWFEDEPELLYSQLSDFAMPDWASKNAHIINAFDHMVLKYGVDFAREYSFSYGSGTNAFDVGLCKNDGFCHWRKFSYLLGGGTLTLTQEMAKNLFSLTDEQREIFHQLIDLYKRAEDCNLHIFYDREKRTLNGINTTHMGNWFDEQDKRFYSNPIDIMDYVESAPCAETAGDTFEVSDVGGLYAILK